jgi:hypothetical protein
MDIQKLQIFVTNKVPIGVIVSFGYNLIQISSLTLEIIVIPITIHLKIITSPIM